ncbi:MAG TPA: hypothetical protein VGY54_17455, partial [Polyangiaceae bacterium]|nr:hypothetical protein [Polyangiaceae bacterium]
YGPGDCGGCFGAFGPNCSYCTPSPNGSYADYNGQTYNCPGSGALSNWHDTACCLGQSVPFCGQSSSSNPCNTSPPPEYGCGNVGPTNQGACAQYGTSCGSLCSGAFVQQAWPDCTCICTGDNGSGDDNGGGGGGSAGDNGGGGGGGGGDELEFDDEGNTD